ncbi:MAG: hypothetical protein K8S97_15445 [Anaerolineae bacterium]|nr:hypothetical protein [Anaerolineae bacterium]
MSVMTVGAVKVGVCPPHYNFHMSYDVSVRMTLLAQLSRGINVGIVIHYGNLQPVVFRLDRAILVNFVTRLTVHSPPLSLLNEWGRFFNLEFAYQAAVGQLVHFWHKVDRRMTACAGAIFTIRAHDKCVRMWAALPGLQLGAGGYYGSIRIRNLRRTGLRLIVVDYQTSEYQKENNNPDITNLSPFGGHFAFVLCGFFAS